MWHVLRRTRGQSKHCKIGKERRRKNKKDARRVRLTTRKCKGSGGRVGREGGAPGKFGSGATRQSLKCFATFCGLFCSLATQIFSQPAPPSSLSDFLLPPSPEDKGAKFSLHFECSELNSAASPRSPSLSSSLSASLSCCLPALAFSLKVKSLPKCEVATETRAAS